MSLRTDLDSYEIIWPDDVSVDQFGRFLDASPDGFERTRRDGHFTGSAWLVSADGERVLLTHHRKLGRWLQLGGRKNPDCRGCAWSQVSSTWTATVSRREARSRNTGTTTFAM